MEEKETKNSEMELMTEQKEENVREEGQKNSFFRHEDEEITVKRVMQKPDAGIDNLLWIL